ncbi:hypothetical protein DESC_10053 [Desulfosarcina cetonica]|nr:hypothetical protein DESC_10053 [Desulfosarcina cetonica]
MLARGEEKTALAAQVAAIGHIVDGAADVQLGDFAVALIPLVVEQRADGFHAGTPPKSGQKSNQVKPGWRHRLGAQVGTPGIIAYPDGKIGVHVVQPGLKGVRIDRMAK